MIARHVSGSGPPLVMVHGAGNDHTSFALVAPHLERSFKVVAVDRRGRGASRDGPRYAFEHEVEDVAEVVRAAGPGAGLMGHSYGALVALEAARLLDGLAGLALYEPPIGPGLAAPALVAELERLRDAGDLEGLLALFLRRVAGMTDAQIGDLRGTPSWRARLGAAPAVPRELRAAGEWRFHAARYAGIAAPVLLLRGELSPPWARESVERVAGALPAAEVRVLAGQGHSATVFAPELLAAELTRFLRN